MVPALVYVQHPAITDAKTGAKVVKTVAKMDAPQPAEEVAVKDVKDPAIACVSPIALLIVNLYVVAHVVAHALLDAKVDVGQRALADAVVDVVATAREIVLVHVSAVVQ